MRCASTAPLQRACPVYLGYVLGYQEIQPSVHEDALAVPHIVLELMLKILNGKTHILF